MREHPAAGRHQRGSMTSHGLIGRNILGVHALRFFNDRLFNLFHRTHPKQFEFLLHTTDRPKQIDGGWPRLPDEVANLIQVALQIACALGLRVLHA